MCQPAAPAAPDPIQTANAQTQSNKDTAIAQTNLNNTDQITPTGSLTYKVIGTNPDGTPHYQATTALNTASQQLFDTGQQTSQLLANLGKDQAGRLSGLLSTPLDLNTATEDNLDALAAKRLDPYQEQQRQALETKLSNQGIKLGSTAYDRATMDLAQQQNDARNQMYLTGRNQAVAEALQQRQEPLNEIIGLTSGTQLQSPNLINTPNTNVANTDTAGITQAGYANQYNQWLQGQNQQQQLLGGLFGLGAAGILRSDRRLKTAIRKVGDMFNGLGLYLYRYKGEAETHLGVMADEVAEAMPAALVWHPDGFWRVNYDLAMGVA